MIDFKLARENMIESQIRPNSITDSRLIAAMETVTREEFVPEDLKSLAYMDEDVSIGTDEAGQKRFMMEPMAFARLVQAAAIQPDDTVLDVGCGTGYSTAVLSRMAQLVVAVERDAALVEAANENLLRLEANNVAVFADAPDKGHGSEAPYNAIIINGRVGEVSDALFEQLEEGGRLVAVVGERDTSQAIVYTKTNGVVAGQYAFDASIPALADFEKQPADFVF